MAKIQYNRIKSVIVECGSSNKELAEALKVTEQTVSSWCTNTKQPSIEKLYEIARALRVDIRELLKSTNNWDEIEKAAQQEKDTKGTNDSSE